VSLRLDLPRLATAIALIGIFAMAVRVPASPDMWWHLRCGEVQWRTRTVLRSETFSHTAPGAPWINQSWLPQLALYALHARGGFAALALAVGLLVAATYSLVWLASRADGDPSAWWAPYWRAGGVLWAAIASGPTWAARPHLLTLLFTALWVYLLERWRTGGRRIKDLLWLPPLMLLWANSHGGYVVGLLLLTIEVGGLVWEKVIHRTHSGHRDAPPTDKILSPPPAAGASRRDIGFLLLIALLCLGAATINPQGVHLLLFPFRTLGSTQQGAIAEWASPDFHAPELWPFLALLLAAWAALALSPPLFSRESPTVLLRALCFSAMALRSSRYIGLAAVVLAPLLIRHGAGVLARINRTRDSGTPRSTRSARGWPAVNWALLALVLLAAGLKVAQPLDSRTIDGVHQQRFPVEATEVLLLQDLPPELFNEYGWGGYLIWANAHPRAQESMPVFIDGRADPYGDELIDAYQRTVSLRPGWQDTLDRYGVRTVLLAADSALGAVLRESGRWQEVYADEVAVIWTRETAR
jgi:hypothetical protein